MKPAIATLIRPLTRPVLLSVLLVWTLAVAAAPELGTPAPEFTVQASKGGEVFSFSLAEQLKQGPVVLYFYPAAFTKGCTVEAHDFADAIDRYAQYHATVIGISHDKIDTLNKFSVSECHSKFAVGADPDLKVAKAYDAILARNPDYADRVSYVIAPDGRLLYRYADMDPAQHVANTLAALAAWAKTDPAKP